MVCNVSYLVVLCFWSQVDSAKKQYNVQISQLTEELLALHMECGEKQGQIERAIREKRAVEEELEKVRQLCAFYIMFQMYPPYENISSFFFPTSHVFP